MKSATATIEMQTPEQHRERLHDLVTAVRTVLVMSRGRGRGGERIVAQPMALVRTTDDTTMHVATLLEARQVAELARDPRVTVVVQGLDCAVFDAEARISRDRRLVDGLAGEWWKSWWRDMPDRSVSILVISPIAGSYWDGPHRYAYQYRLAPRAAKGVPVRF
ncbi:MAG TPA: pyridoxamine 5'-phosphate oxidase family protein [Kofleriaceae bacterium]